MSHNKRLCDHSDESASLDYPAPRLFICGLPQLCLLSLSCFLFFRQRIAVQKRGSSSLNCISLGVSVGVSSTDTNATEPIRVNMVYALRLHFHYVCIPIVFTLCLHSHCAHIMSAFPLCSHYVCIFCCVFI